MREVAGISPPSVNRSGWIVKMLRSTVEIKGLLRGKSRFRGALASK